MYHADFTANDAALTASYFYNGEYAQRAYRKAVLLQLTLQWLFEVWRSNSYTGIDELGIAPDIEKKLTSEVFGIQKHV